MGMMKTIRTGWLQSGKESYLASLPKYEREVVAELIKNRNKPPKQQKVIGDIVLVLGHQVEFPVFEGTYFLCDSLTRDQRIVQVCHQDDWYVMEVGSTFRQRLSDFTQRNYRWVVIHPLQKEVFDGLKRRT